MTQVTTPWAADLAAPARELLRPHTGADRRSSSLRAGPVALLLPVADLAATALALVVVARIGVELHRLTVLTLVVAWAGLLVLSGRYTTGPLGEAGPRRATRVLASGGMLGLASWILEPLVGRQADPAALVPVVLALVGGALITTGLSSAVRQPIRVVLVADPTDAQVAATELGSSPHYVVAAACVSEEPLVGIGDLPVRVGVEDSVTVARETKASAIIAIPGPGLTTVTLRRLLWHAAAADIPVYIGTGLLDVAPARMSCVQGAGLDLIHVRPAPSRGPRRIVKGVFDRVLAGSALLVLWPLLAVLALAIRRDSPGPAVFRQERVGRDGRLFTLYKFRTMCAGAEVMRQSLDSRNECDGPLFKVQTDPRITRLGAFLRRYSIDELPQLVNVLFGQMSLVGPRPALQQEVDLYTEDPRRRLAVKPGVTGLWQVSGRSNLSWAESVRLDVRYVDNWSLGLDLAILWRTIGAVLSHRGAY